MTIYIALTEYLLVAVPIGLVVWHARAAGASRVVSVGLEGAAIWVLGIALIGHIRALSLPRHLRETGDTR